MDAHPHSRIAEINNMNAKKKNKKHLLSKNAEQNTVKDNKDGAIERYVRTRQQLISKHSSYLSCWTTC